LGSKIIPPEVAIVGMQIVDVQLVESAIAVDVRIDNENPEPFRLSGGVHKIYVDGQYVGKALDNTVLDVPALGSTRHRVIAHVSNLSLATRFSQIINSGAYDYQIKSTVHASYGSKTGALAGTRRFNVGREGRVDLQKLGLGPAFRQQQPAPRSQPQYQAPRVRQLTPAEHAPVRARATY